MHKSISSFFLSFFLLWHCLGRHEKHQFPSGPTQRGSPVCPYALAPHVSFQEKLHTKDILHYGDLWGGSMDAQTDLFFLSFFLSFLLLWHRLGRHEKLRFASEPTQRRSLVYALTPHCLLPRKASYKKYYSPGDLWGGGSMDAQIDLFLPSFFLSFFLLWHRLGQHKKLQFASGPTHRGSLVSLSMLLHRMSLLPRKASHKKTFLSYLLQISSISTNTKIDHRQNVMRNSLRKHHHSTTQTSSNNFLKSLLFTLQWTDLNPTSLCISFSVWGGRGSDHPDLYIFIASWNQFKAHPNSCCFQGPLQHDIH